MIIRILQLEWKWKKKQYMALHITISMLLLHTSSCYQESTVILLDVLQTRDHVAHAWPLAGRISGTL
jgi:hypothetical protein